MKKIFSLLFVLILGGLISQTFADAVYYVSPGGNDTNDGTSKTTAFKTIQKATSVLADNTPTTIYLEENATFEVASKANVIKVLENKKVTISGKNTTIKAGDQPYLGNRMLEIAVNSDVKVSGVIFKNGCSRDGIPGGALFFDGNTLEIDSCSFLYNEGNSSGGALASRGKDVIITNTVFDSNRVFGGYGGGAVLYHCGLPTIDGVAGEPGALIIRNCSFTNNEGKADTKGDVIGLIHAYRVSEDPRGLGNPSYSNVNYLEITNCLFKDNIGVGGQGTTIKYASDIYLTDSRKNIEVNLVNNTFYNSRTLSIPFFYNAIRLINNVFYKKTETDESKNYIMASFYSSEEREPIVAYNNVFLGLLGKLGANIDDPALTTEKETYKNQIITELSQLGLANYQSDDKHVYYLPVTNAASVLIDNGISSTEGLDGFETNLVPAGDILGNTIAGSAKDIGAFEYGETTGIAKLQNTQGLFSIGRSGDNAVVKNLSGKTVNLQIRLLDGRTIYSSPVTGELIINRSELQIPNGVLIFSVNNGIASESKKVILF
jgi:predicted outer membrane repeat protein